MPDAPYSIRSFRAEDAAAFAALNRRWIDAYFGMEEEDRRVLDAPEATILQPGGYIAIAEWDGQVVGTGALMVPPGSPHPPPGFELVKMATDPSAQGQGVGGALLDHLIAAARNQGARSIWLETNDKLGAAMRLYARKGFRALTPEEEHPTPYSRCNLQMVLTL